MNDLSTYRLAIFDMDGTLLNTLEDLHDAMAETLRWAGLPQPTLAQTKQRIGNGVKVLVKRSCPDDATDEILQKVHRHFAEFYALHNTAKTRPYDGIPEALDALRRQGVLTAVVSNKIDPAVHTLCKHYFPGAFDAILGEKDGLQRKPAPDMVDAVLEELGIPRRQALYIGDSEVDSQTAVNAGVDAMLVTWGFREKSLLETLPHKFLVETPQALLKLLA